MTKRETTKAPPELDALGYAIGRDGLPTDPRHHWNADTCPREELISESISKQLDACERAWRPSKTAISEWPVTPNAPRNISKNIMLPCTSILG
jgi:hypothetical protein